MTVVKPGWRCTEFWFGLLVLVGFLFLCCFKDFRVAIGWGIPSAVLSAYYTQKRTAAKTSSQPVSSSLFERFPMPLIDLVENFADKTVDGISAKTFTGLSATDHAAVDAGIHGAIKAGLVLAKHYGAQKLIAVVTAKHPEFADVLNAAVGEL